MPRDTVDYDLVPAGQNEEFSEPAYRPDTWDWVAENTESIMGVIIGLVMIWCVVFTYLAYSSMNRVEDRLDQMEDSVDDLRHELFRPTRR